MVRFGPVVWVVVVIQPSFLTEPWVEVETGAQVRLVAVIRPWPGLVTEP